MRPLDALTALRAAIGLATYLTPGAVTRLLDFRRPAGADVRYVCRIWGARNLTLAVATRTAPPSARRGWLAANVAIDLVDLASGLRFVRHRRPGRLARLTATVPPAVAAGCGIAARRAQVPRTSQRGA
jgi:hypothetical protein